MKILVGCMALIVILGACARSFTVNVIEATNDEQTSRTIVKFLASEPARVDERLSSATGLLYICDHDGEYESRSRIVRLGAGAFEASFPYLLSARTHMAESGLVGTGWPEDLVKEQGQCFKVGAGDQLGRIFESQEVRLTIDSRDLP